MLIINNSQTTFFFSFKGVLSAFLWAAHVIAIINWGDGQ